MSEVPLYLSLGRNIASPSFAYFCKGFRGAAVQEFRVKADGTGIYLKASNRSIELVYKANSLNRVLAGKISAPEGQLNWFPEGKEALIREYIPLEDTEQAQIAIEPTNVIHGLVSVLYEGEKLEEAVLETRLGRVFNAGRFRTPEDTPFFLANVVPMRFNDNEIMLFMEPGTFLHAVCETEGKKTTYVPKEADR